MGNLGQINCSQRLWKVQSGLTDDNTPARIESENYFFAIRIFRSLKDTKIVKIGGQTNSRQKVNLWPVTKCDLSGYKMTLFIVSKLLAWRERERGTNSERHLLMVTSIDSILSKNKSFKEILTEKRAITLLKHGFLVQNAVIIQSNDCGSVGIPEICGLNPVICEFLLTMNFI